MQFTQHASNNAVLCAPADWDHSSVNCSALPITRTQVAGQPVMVSFWRPTAEELALLNAGHQVSLYVYGTTHPPVSIGVEP
jgi:hypothetical protein